STSRRSTRRSTTARWPSLTTSPSGKPVPLTGMEEFARAADTNPTVKRPSLLLAAIFGALAFASSASASNPFGITVVRFVTGTPPAQMRAAVSSAGGAVVSDLSPIGALAAVPTANGFAERIRRNPSVVAAFQDALPVNGRGN